MKGLAIRVLATAWVASIVYLIRRLQETQNRFDNAMRWGIHELALGFGVDYEDFAPKSSAEALVRHIQSRGKESDE